MKKVLGNSIVVFFFLIVFAPIGIFLMFTFTDWSNGMKLALATIFGIGFVAAVVMTVNESAALEAQQNLMYIKNVNAI